MRINKQNQQKAFQILSHITYDELPVWVKKGIEKKFQDVFAQYPEAKQYMQSVTMSFKPTDGFRGDGHSAEYYKDRNHIDKFMAGGWMWDSLINNIDEIPERDFKRYFISTYLLNIVIHELIHSIQNYFRIKGLTHEKISAYPDEENPDYQNFGKAYHNDPGEIQAHSIHSEITRDRMFGELSEEDEYDDDENIPLNLSWNQENSLDLSYPSKFINVTDKEHNNMSEGKEIDAENLKLDKKNPELFFEKGLHGLELTNENSNRRLTPFGSATKIGWLLPGGEFYEGQDHFEILFKHIADLTPDPKEFISYYSNIKDKIESFEIFDDTNFAENYRTQLDELFEKLYEIAYTQNWIRVLRLSKSLIVNFKTFDINKKRILEDFIIKEQMPPDNIIELDYDGKYETMLIKDFFDFDKFSSLKLNWEMYDINMLSQKDIHNNWPTKVTDVVFMIYSNRHDATDGWEVYKAVTNKNTPGHIEYPTMIEEYDDYEDAKNNAVTFVRMLQNQNKEPVMYYESEHEYQYLNSFKLNWNLNISPTEPRELIGWLCRLGREYVIITQVENIRNDVFNIAGLWAATKDEIHIIKNNYLGKKESKFVGILSDIDVTMKSIKPLEYLGEKEAWKLDKTSSLKLATPDSNPSEAQIEAGNYKKDHVKKDGFDITIENKKGSMRSGTDKDGKKWSVKMKHDYGYIKGTEGKDGDHVDVILADDYKEGQSVFIVNQTDDKGKFDEHKCCIGFISKDDAEKAYLDNYEKGWDNYESIIEMPMDQFKEWVRDKKYTKNIAKPLKLNWSVPQTDLKNQELLDVWEISKDTAFEICESATNGFRFNAGWKWKWLLDDADEFMLQIRKLKKIAIPLFDLIAKDPETNTWQDVFVDINSTIVEKFYPEKVNELKDKLNSSLTLWNTAPVLQDLQSLSEIENLCQYISEEDGYVWDDGIYVTQLEKEFPGILNRYNLHILNGRVGKFISFNSLDHAVRRELEKEGYADEDLFASLKLDWANPTVETINSTDSVEDMEYVGISGPFQRVPGFIDSNTYKVELIKDEGAFFTVIRKLADGLKTYEEAEKFANDYSNENNIPRLIFSWENNLSKQADVLTYTDKSDIDSSKQEFDDRANFFHQDIKGEESLWAEPDYKNTIEFKNDNNIMHFDEFNKRPNTSASLKLDWENIPEPVRILEKYSFPNRDYVSIGKVSRNNFNVTIVYRTEGLERLYEIKETIRDGFSSLRDAREFADKYAAINSIPRLIFKKEERELTASLKFTAGLEERINFLKQKFPQLQPNIINAIVTADPTPNKQYIFWLAKQLTNGTIQLPEDSSRSIKALTEFENLKKKQDFNAQKDINQYQSFNDLEEVVDTYSGALQSKREKVKEVKQEGAKVILQDDPWKIIELYSPEAVCQYAENTKWCVSEWSTAIQYLRGGNLYLVLKNNQKFGLLEIKNENLDEDQNINDLSDTVQFMDVRDRAISLRNLDTKLKKLIIQIGRRRFFDFDRGFGIYDVPGSLLERRVFSLPDKLPIQEVKYRGRVTYELQSIFEDNASNVLSEFTERNSFGKKYPALYDIFKKKAISWVEQAFQYKMFPDDHLIISDILDWLEKSDSKTYRQLILQHPDPEFVLFNTDTIKFPPEKIDQILAENYADKLPNKILGNTNQREIRRMLHNIFDPYSYLTARSQVAETRFITFLNQITNKPQNYSSSVKRFIYQRAIDYINEVAKTYLPDLVSRIPENLYELFNKPKYYTPPRSASLNLNWRNAEELRGGDRVKYIGGFSERIVEGYEMDNPSGVLQDQLEDLQYQLDNGVGIVNSVNPYGLEDICKVRFQSPEYSFELLIATEDLQLVRRPSFADLSLNWQGTDRITYPEDMAEGTVAVFLVHSDGGAFPGNIIWKVKTGKVFDKRTDGYNGVTMFGHSAGKQIATFDDYEEAVEFAEAYAAEHNIIYYISGVDKEMRDKKALHTTAMDLSFNKYDKERGQQLVDKEKDSPAINSLDMQQSYNTDFFLPDLDHDKKEREALDWTGRENLQLGIASLKLDWEKVPDIINRFQNRLKTYKSDVVSYYELSYEQAYAFYFNSESFDKVDSWVANPNIFYYYVVSKGKYVFGSLWAYDELHDQLSLLVIEEKSKNNLNWSSTSRPVWLVYWAVPAEKNLTKDDKQENWTIVIYADDYDEAVSKSREVLKRHMRELLGFEDEKKDYWFLPYAKMWYVRSEKLEFLSKYFSEGEVKEFIDNGYLVVDKKPFETNINNPLATIN